MNSKIIKLPQKDQIIQFITTLTIVLEEKYFKLNPFFIKFIALISEFQLLGMILIHSEIHNKNIQYNLLDIYYWLAIVARPYLILQFSNQFFRYAFIIPLIFYCIIILHHTIFYLMYAKSAGKTNIFDFLHKTSNFQTIINTFIVVHQTLFDQILIIPYIELCIISINLALEGQFQVADLVIVLFSIFTIFIIIIQKLFNIFMIQETISIIIVNFKVLILLGSDYFAQLIVLMIAIIDSLNLDQNTKLYSISVIYAIHMLIQLYNILIYTIHVQDIANFYLSIKSASLLCVSVVLIKHSNQQIQHYDIVVLTVLQLVIVKIIHTLNYQFKYQLLTKQLDSIHSNIYLLVYFMNNNEIDMFMQTLLNKFIYIHREICINNICYCKQQHILEYNQIKLYIFQLALDYSRNLNKVVDQNSKSYYSLFYIDILMKVNQQVKAYQQANIILLRQVLTQNNEEEQVMLSESTFLSSADELATKSKKKKNIFTRFQRVQIQNINYVVWQKLVLLLEISKQRLIQGFSVEDVKSKVDLSQSIQLFMRIEEQNNQLKYQINNILNKKKDLYTLLAGNQKIRANNFLTQCLDLITRIMVMDKHLNFLFQEFPSRKMQSICSFYQAEIVNNYLQAYKVINYNAMSDSALVKIQKNQMVDLLSQKVQYLICALDHQGIGLQIKNKSPTLHKLFNYEIQEFNSFPSINSLLPNGFQNTHKHLVEQFLVTGHGKFYKQKNNNLILCKSGFLKNIDFFFDFDLTRLSELTFQVFFSENQCQNTCLIVGQKLTILGVTKEFCTQFKIEKEYQEFVTQIIHQDITLLIPSFYQLIQNCQNNKLYIFNNTQLKFIEQTKLQDFFLHNRENSQVNEAIQNYTSDISVFCGYGYYVVELKNLYFQNYQTNATISDVMFQDQSNELMDYIDLEILKEQVIPLPNDFNQDLFIKIMGTSQFYKMELGNNQERANLDPQVNVIPDDYPQDIMSPGRTGRLIDKTNSFNVSQNQLIQQRFYRKQNEQENSVKSFDSKLEKQMNRDNDRPQEQQNNDFKENLKQQLHQDGQTSNQQILKGLQDNAGSSTLGTFSQNFQLFKKYDVIQQLIDSQTFSLYFDLMLSFLVIMFIIQIIFSIVLISNSSNDIQGATSEVQVLDYQASLMNPVYNCLASFTAILNYQLLTEQNDTIQLLMDQNKYHVADSYNQIVYNYKEQSENQYLNNFLIDQLIDVEQINGNNTIMRQINLREAIFQLIESHYKFSQLNFDKIDPLYQDTGFFVYFLSNTQVFNNQTQTVNDNLLQHIMDYTILLEKKWIVLCVRCTYLVLLTYLTAWLLYIKFIRKYSKILKIFLKADTIWVFRDLDRIKELVNVIQKDSDVVFKYRFNIELKEQFYLAEQNKKSQFQTKLALAGFAKQKRVSKLLLSRLPSFILFSCFFTVYFFYAVVLNLLGINYLSQYSIDSQSFRNISSLGLATPMLYSLREINYQKNAGNPMFTFLTQQDMENNLIDIENSLQMISNFLLLSVNGGGSTSYSTLSNLNSQNLCQYLPEELITNMDNCQSIYDGVLLRGLQVTLTKIRDQIQLEMNSSDSFNIRDQLPYNEIEISLILSDTIQQIKTDTKYSLINNAQQLNNSIQIFSIIFIVISVLQILIASLFSRKYFYDQYQLIKLILLLLPQPALFVDDLFERQLRQLISKERLV